MHIHGFYMLVSWFALVSLSVEIDNVSRSLCRIEAKKKMVDRDGFNRRRVRRTGRRASFKEVRPTD